MTRGLCKLAALSVLAAVLAACEGADEGPRPRPELPRPDANYSVPKIKSPLDLSKYANAPCRLLSNDQVDALGFPSDGIYVEGCRWSTGVPEGKPSITTYFEIIVNPPPRGGLAAFYAHDQKMNRAGKSGKPEDRALKGYRTSWEPSTIVGYPAASTRNNNTTVALVACALVVGVADEQMFQVVDRLDPSGRPDCARAERAAEFVIENLRDQAR